MSRLGSGTTTDTTSTSNELYFAGESFRLNYDIGTGTGNKRVQTNLTNFTVEAKLTRVTLSTAGDLATATIPTTDNNIITITAVATADELTAGKFYISIPSDILKQVGYDSTSEPTPGNPVYIAYALSYTEGSGVTNPESRVIEEDVIGFKYRIGFDIT